MGYVDAVSIITSENTAYLGSADTYIGIPFAAHMYGKLSTMSSPFRAQ